MKQVSKTVTRFQCDTCKTEYHNRREAFDCEAKPCEKKMFSVGDKVSNKEKRTCIGGKHYIFRGHVIRVIGPEPPDEEYEIKWLGGKRLDRHVYHFEVRYRCPVCKKTKTALYYAPELKLLARGKKKVTKKKTVKKKAKKKAKKKKRTRKKYDPKAQCRYRIGCMCYECDPDYRRPGE